jgi:preprotein translocase subunit SecF
MYLFKKEPTFKFLNKRWYAFGISGVVILIGVILYFTRGFNMGIDFSGGTMLEVSFREPMNVSRLRAALSKVGMGEAQITRVGNENKFFIKTMTVSEKSMETETMEDHEKVARTIKRALMNETARGYADAGKLDLNNSAEGEIGRFLRSKGLSEEDAAESARSIIDRRKTATGIIDRLDALENSGLKHRVISLLKESCFLGDFSVLSVEIVGPQVGKDLRRKAALACIWALIGMLIYIAFRFKFLYGLSGVLTLAHDVLTTLAFVLVFRIEMSLQVVAAVLTITGYSINDTIVVFDRLRDNLKIMRKENLEAILDKSLNQTLSRSIFTSFTVFLTVLSLVLFGGEVIRPFATTMLFGVITGSYSTIYQSCAWLKIWEKSFLKRKKI